MTKRMIRKRAPATGNRPAEQDEIRWRRFCEILSCLAEKGLNQRQVGERLGLPPQVMSDLKHRRRPVSDLVCHRVSATFGFPVSWHLGESGAPTFDSRRLVHGRERAPLPLPILSTPARDNPLNSPAWGGETFELCGKAAALAEASHWPYLLRINCVDLQGRLLKNDLVLISQSVYDLAPLCVLEDHGDRFLAQRQKPRGWRSLCDKRSIADTAEQIGACLAIVWADLGSQQVLRD